MSERVRIYSVRGQFDPGLDLMTTRKVVLASDYDALHAEAEALRGLTPELPPRPPEGTGLPRYALRWNGPAQPLSVPMDDGYWTPWHLAEALRAENGRLREERDSFQREGIRAIEQLEESRVLLLEAAEDIESWGAYASAYFQEKHDLNGCAMKYRMAGNGEQEDRQEANQDVRALVEALEQCAASLAWNRFGACRAIHAGPIMPAAMALDKARTALAAHHQAQQSAPEQVSVPRDLLADLISSDHDTKIQAERALYALLDSQAEQGTKP